MPCKSFTEALYVKYGELVEETACCIEECEIFVVGSPCARTTPTGKLVLPRALFLNQCDIDRAGNAETIRELCQDVDELDLTKNNLNDLCEINKIISEMPNLCFLNMSHNDMSEATPTEITQKGNITNLILTNTHISWACINCLLDVMPNVEELHLSLNDCSSVQLNSNKQYPNVRKLNMNGNHVASWKEVLMLDHCFPNLEALCLADCNIDSIPDYFWKHSFHSLRALNMSNNPLRHWQDIERLNNLEYLSEVRLSGIPLLECLTAEERRQHLIARMPKITRLNGSVIAEAEREDSERSFIRYYMGCEEKPDRVYKLEDTHGKLDPLIDIDLSPKKTAKVDLIFNEQRETIVINLQQCVRDLKCQIGQLYGVAPAKLRVFYIDQDLCQVVGPEELRFKTKKLYTYNIQDGDELLVDVK